MSSQSIAQKLLITLHHKQLKSSLAFPFPPAKPPLHPHARPPSMPSRYRLMLGFYMDKIFARATRMCPKMGKTMKTGASQAIVSHLTEW